MIVHPSLAVNILVVVGESFWVFSISAQLHRLVKTRNTRGLSAPSYTLNAAGNIAWATYFFTNHLWYPFATNTLLFFLTVVALGYILFNRKQFAKGLVTIATIGPLTSYLLIAHPGWGGWIGMGYNWIAGTPWLYRIVKRKKVSGLSEQGIYFALGAMSCVLAYGVIIHSSPLITGSLQGFAYELTVLRFYYRHRKHG
ncbi:MAG TPA: PQ-loop domain-containing transporter [Candidatus Saccharimonadales bacterium]